MDDCLFCRMISGEIPTDVVLDTEDFFAFRDIAPQAPVHVLVIPKVHHRDIEALSGSDATLAGRLLAAAAAVADDQGIAAGGYRLVLNTGPEGGQSVFHVHAHVLGGRQMLWPPG